MILTLHLVACAGRPRAHSVLPLHVRRRGLEVPLHRVGEVLVDVVSARGQSDLFFGNSSEMIWRLSKLRIRMKNNE